MPVESLAPESAQQTMALPSQATAEKRTTLSQNMVVCHLSPVKSRLDARTYYMQMLPSASLGVRTLLIGPHGRKSGHPDVEMVPITVHGNRALRVLLALTAALRRRHLRADLYHLHNPEMIPAGLILKLAFRKRSFTTPKKTFLP